MLLAIDAGNTNTVFAVFEGDNLRGQWRMATDARRTADEYGVWLLQLFERADIPQSSIDAVVLSTVVPQALFALRTLSRQYFSAEALVIGEEDVKTGIRIAIDRPSEVGADRIVNSLAAWQKHGKPLVIVDFGTATTFDVVNKKGEYCGGVIAPGINLSLEALHRAAAKLPNISIERPASVIGKGTVEAMQSGIYYGYIGLIEGIIARIEEEVGVTVHVIATGGLAPLFAKGTPAIKELDSDLTIHGLKAIYALNR